MSDKLAEICGRKQNEVAVRKRQQPSAIIDAAARSAPPARGFRHALKRKLAAGGYGLVAEIKKASPSAGVIRADFQPAMLARSYEAGGAACLSVLTDTPYFQGQDDHLTVARAACTLPVLRKDFMLDPWQIAESRSLGADCVLLILAVLSDVQARELADTAADHGMDVLMEVHDDAELERAVALGARIIGINNRNLKTLVTDLTVTERLAPLAPPDTLLVCESGITGSADVARMARVGARCFLVGESLMREADVTAATRMLLAVEAEHG